jgi:Metal binding domain of Ada
MQSSRPISWPSARLFAEAIQCPTICFAHAELRDTIPAVDKLGMPLVTSGQFAYVYKLRSQRGVYAVRCFRGHMGDREQRYQLIDEHLHAQPVPAFARFAYDAQGILISGRRYPVLVMEWLEGPTLDVYLAEVIGRREVLLHLADEWVKLLASLRAAGVAHGDLQHGNIIVEHGQFRLVDFDGLFVPAMTGWAACEVGHQHYQHPARDANYFNADLDNFAGLVIYLSLIALAERPTLWTEHHDENLLFTKDDFAAPERSSLFAKIKEIGGEHRDLAELLEEAARSSPEAVPSLLDVRGANADAKLPTWMTAPADMDVIGQTREAPQAAPPPASLRAPAWIRTSQPHGSRMPNTPGSVAVQSVFSGSAPVVPYAGHNPPADLYELGQHALRHARTFARERKSFFWWYIGLYNLLYLFGMPFATALIFTVLVLTGICLIYGVVRAIREPQPSLLGAGAGTTALPYANAPRASQWSLMPSAPAAATPTQPAPVVMRAVVGNLTLGIFHQDRCEWAQKIPQKNRVAFPTTAVAQAAGYRACQVCFAPARRPTY